MSFDRKGTQGSVTNVFRSPGGRQGVKQRGACVVIKRSQGWGRAAPPRPNEETNERPAHCIPAAAADHQLPLWSGGHQLSGDDALGAAGSSWPLNAPCP